MSRGRPSSYKPEYADQARKLCEFGATDYELADFFGIVTSTVWRWAKDHEDFRSALKAGKEAADERVERSLYSKACGYTYESEEIFCHDGEVTRVPVTKHIPPDTTSMIFWLKNRRPLHWRDKREVSGSPDQPVLVRFVWGDGSA